jgi:Spy/CpxP family protein refolding chaperone
MKLSQSVFRIFGAAILATMPMALSAQPAEPSPNIAQRLPGAAVAGAQGFALGGPVGALTDQQRTSYEAAMARQRPRMMELQSQLRTARADFVAASVDQKFDENSLRQKAMAAYRIEAEMAVMRAKAMSEVQPPLSAEQIERIKATQSAQVRPLRPRQPLENTAPRNPAVNTNTDPNGLPPKK